MVPFALRVVHPRADPAVVLAHQRPANIDENEHPLGGVPEAHVPTPYAADSHKCFPAQKACAVCVHTAVLRFCPPPIVDHDSENIGDNLWIEDINFLTFSKYSP